MKIKTTNNSIAVGMVISPFLILKAFCLLYLGLILWTISKGRKLIHNN